jgi:DNA-binding Xre family transcriptional regulator
MTAALMNAPVPPKFTKRDERKAVQQSKVKLRCRLQDLMDAQGMTRTALSQATGLTSAAIRGLCDNTSKRYDADTLAVLCDYFGCDMNTLFEIVTKEGRGD